jgi:hypothetical protein
MKAPVRTLAAHRTFADRIAVFLNRRKVCTLREQKIFCSRRSSRRKVSPNARSISKSRDLLGRTAMTRCNSFAEKP